MRDYFIILQMEQVLRDTTKILCASWAASPQLECNEHGIGGLIIHEPLSCAGVYLVGIAAHFETSP